MTEAATLRRSFPFTVMGKLQRWCEQPKTRSNRLISLLSPPSKGEPGDCARSRREVGSSLSRKITRFWIFRFEGYGKGSTGPTKRSRFDNLKITKVPSLKCYRKAEGHTRYRQVVRRNELHAVQSWHRLTGKLIMSAECPKDRRPGATAGWHAPLEWMPLGTSYLVVGESLCP